MDETFDVVVVGFGFGGGISALNAAQRGAKTLLIEKSTVPGGLSICRASSARRSLDLRLDRADSRCSIRSSTAAPASPPA